MAENHAWITETFNFLLFDAIKILGLSFNVTYRVFK